jgi:glycosyltransferase involved in cell wall biosynthesis
MGKNKKIHKTTSTVTMSVPFVSLCTPTFNRRPFIPFMIKCFEHFTYPKDKIEWIIIDDGTDPIEDLVKDIPQVKYFYYPEKMFLGKKRNLMHTKCTGDIIIYMDDDDYYPPERVTHAVEKLQNNPGYLIAGSSEMHIYFDSKKCIYQCGPYKEYHATAATFAFKKELLNITKYNDEVAIAEEKQFLDAYSIPLIQLDTLKTILVFSHRHNSLNKEKLLVNPESTKTKLSVYSVDDFIKDSSLKQFYMCDMNHMLDNYEAGSLDYKPEVKRQIEELEIKRNQMIQEYNNKKNNTMINDTTTQLTNRLSQYEKQLEQKTCLIDELLKKVRNITNDLNQCKEIHMSNIDALNTEINELSMSLERANDKIDKLSWFIVKSGVNYSEITLFD